MKPVSHQDPRLPQELAAGLRLLWTRLEWERWLGEQEERWSIGGWWQEQAEALRQFRARGGWRPPRPTPGVWPQGALDRYEEDGDDSWWYW